MLSLASSCVCSFVNRTVTLVETGDGNPIGDSANTVSLEGSEADLLRNQGIGFWGWTSSEGTCYAYTINGQSPSMDSAFQVSSIFSTLIVLFGGIVVVCLMLGIVFPVGPKHYKILGFTSCLLSILAFSTLAITGSSACAPGFFQYSLAEDMPLLKDITTSSCGVGLGSTFSIVAGFVWILVGVICIKSPLGDSSREPGAYRGVHKDSGTADDGDGEADDEATRLHRQRQADNDERYRKLMGEIDDESADEEANPGLVALENRRGRLSLVREEDDVEDPGIIQRDRDSLLHSDPRQEEQFDDEHSEALSQYSEEGMPLHKFGNAADPQLLRPSVVDGRPSPQSARSGPNEASEHSGHDGQYTDDYEGDGQYADDYEGDGQYADDHEDHGQYADDREHDGQYADDREHVGQYANNRDDDGEHADAYEDDGDSYSDDDESYNDGYDRKDPRSGAGNSDLV